MVAGTTGIHLMIVAKYRGDGELTAHLVAIGGQLLVTAFFGGMFTAIELE